MLHTGHKTSRFWMKARESVKIWLRKEENCGLPSFSKGVAGMHLVPGIAVTAPMQDQWLDDELSRPASVIKMFCDPGLSILPAL
jgi:hypothetical protein